MGFFTKIQASVYRVAPNKLTLKTQKIKTMATVFLGPKEFNPCGVYPRGETINSMAYFETLQRLRHDIQNKRHGMLPEKVFLIMLDLMHLQKHSKSFNVLSRKTRSLYYHHTHTLFA